MPFFFVYWQDVGWAPHAHRRARGLSCVAGGSGGQSLPTLRTTPGLV